MPTLRDILSVKGSSVFSVGADVTVLNATQVMNRQRIGALVVMSGGATVGMFTERDVLSRVVAEGRDPATTLVAEVMTENIVAVGPDTDVDEASSIMRDRRIRHLPVMGDEGRLLGMVSIGDVNALHASDQKAQLFFLNEYIYGRA